MTGAPVRAHRASAAMAALVIALGAAAWGPTVGFGYTLDDRGIAYGNAFVERFDAAAIFTNHLRAGSTVEAEPDAADFLYRPVPLLTFAVDHAIAPNDPRVGHLVNVVLHAVAAGLSWILFRRLGTPAPVAAFAAMVALLHPVHVEAVANLKHREEILAAIGILAAWLAVERAWGARGPARAAIASILAAAWLFAAMLSKESAAFGVLAIPLSSVFLHARAERPWRRIAWIHAPIAAAAWGWLALRSVVVGSLTTTGNEVFFLPSEGFLTRLLTTAKVWASWYLGRGGLLLDTPVGISSRAVVPIEEGWPSAAAWAGLGILVLSAAGGFAAWRRGRREIAFWISFFWIALLPTSNLAVAIGSVGAFRFLYVPSLAWGVLAGFLAWNVLPRLFPGSGSIRAFRAAFVVLAALLAAASAREVRPWRDDGSLNASDLRRTSNPRARYVEAWRTGDPAAREMWLRETVGIMESIPGSARGMETTLLARAYHDLAEIELSRGALAGAETFAGKALAVLEPDSRFHRYRCFPLGVLARAAEARGDVAGAIGRWRESSRAEPLFVAAYFERARLERLLRSIEGEREALMEGISALRAAGRRWLGDDLARLEAALRGMPPG